MTDFNWTAWIGNLVSPFAIVGVVFGWFPTIAIMLAIIWYLVQLYESHFMQTRMGDRRLRRMAKLRIEIAKLEALELLAHPVFTVDKVVIAAAVAAAERVLQAARQEASSVVDQAKRDKIPPDETY